MTFPQKLSDLDHLRSEPMIRFKDEVVTVDGVDHTFTVVCYMIANPELWALPLAKECRGITYDSNGNCVGAPFEKFFNVGEMEETRMENLPDGDFVVMEKRDGSMLIPIQVGSRILFKTKKTFTSDVANLANALVPKNVLNLCQFFLMHNMTPIIEFTHPDSRIVIDYGPRPEFVVLAVRSMITGLYSSMSFVEAVCEEYDVRCIEWDASSNLKMTVQEFADSLETQEGVEGAVIWFQTFSNTPSSVGGLRVKRKTQWYNDRHRISTGLRERDIAEMVLNETVDDVKAFVVELGFDLTPLLEIEHRVTTEMSAIQMMVAQTVGDNAHLGRKDFAIKFKDAPLFSLMMNQFLGKDPDVVKHYTKHILPTFSLRTVFSDFKKEPSSDVE